MSRKKYNIGDLGKLKELIEEYGEKEGRRQYQSWYQRQYNNLPEPSKKRKDATKKHYNDNFKHLQKNHLEPPRAIDDLLTIKHISPSSPVKLMKMLERISNGIADYSVKKPGEKNSKQKKEKVFSGFLTTKGNPWCDLANRK